jgi:hypothetical protein
MRWITAVFLAIHGLIHMMGFAKAFGYAELPQLRRPVSREMGLVWFAAGVLVLASAALMMAWPRRWWMLGIFALILSQATIISAWRDAWAGTLANVVLLLAVAYGWFTEGPLSFRTQFERDASAGLSRLDPAVAWETVDARTVRARLTNGAHTISATMLFGDDGLAINFLSDDRSRASPDGKVFTRLRFSTPMREYRDFGPARLATHGEARWLLPEGEFAYGEFEIREVAYNVRR